MGWSPSSAALGPFSWRTVIGPTSPGAAPKASVPTRRSRSVTGPDVARLVDGAVAERPSGLDRVLIGLWQGQVGKAAVRATVPFSCPTCAVSASGAGPRRGGRCGGR
jgi:hypothetical protein